ncbi:unannotated protein [freshwater metagenome]|uniref:Unannotated protein n=1 Tax=freshwater metagenome TaxID=449393 RepID=A0A6J7J8K6_9ZZZZ|nr:bifunctional hydroxymethylpyrimidine kinase/phosphomethylpyrimidine kinase [Actinomycetota bacterium]
MSGSRVIPVCLAIAGSDSGGGAGIQADLKAFAMAGVHGATAITAITAQNTRAVIAVEAVSPALILAQVRAVVEDLGVQAVKTGMLGGPETIAAVAQALGELPRGVPIVVDPVMVAESGARLLAGEAEAVLRDTILPLATVVTPNVPEARAITGRHELDGADLARAVLALGPRVVVLTGGHRDVATDVLVDADGIEEIAGPRHPDGAAHGSGCTHASTLAARLALGDDPRAAARHARRIAGDAVRDGLRDIGNGPGPVDVLGLLRRAAR